MMALAHTEMPRWWRMLIIAIGTLILCSCRGPMFNAVGGANPHSQPQVLPPQAAGPMVPFVQHARKPNLSVSQAAYHSPQAASISAPPSPALSAWGPQRCATCPSGACPHTYPRVPTQQPWISNLTPGDEYICDGGDQERAAKVGADFQVYGLDLEDTVVHYDTLAGRRLVEPSNKVCIYAPRFAAVRQVSGLSQHEQHDLVGRVHLPVSAVLNEETQLASQLNQPLQPVGQIGTKQASIFRERNAGVPLDNTQGLIAVDAEQRLLVPYRILETGVFEQADKARLAGAIDAAIAWSHDHGVGVMLGEQRLVIDTHDTRLGETFVVEHKGNPAIRIIKVASKKDAQPGDFVEFTLRFDNIGDEAIGNVTILDNLTTRLEYVGDSEDCSIDAAFFVEPNEGQSLALRWEIIEPMQPGEGGVISFKCRVR